MTGSEQPTRQRTRRSKQAVTNTILVVFAVEFAVMLLLTMLALPFGPLLEALVDATLLSIGILPFVLWIERRRRAADERARQLAAIVEHASDAIVRSTLDGRIVSWNSAAQRLTGYAATEIIGRPVTTPVAPEHQHQILPLLERVKHGEVISEWETRGLRKDGTRFEATISVAPIRDDSDFVLGAAVIARDLTEHHRLVRELRQALAEVRTLSGLLPICAKCKRVRDDTGYWKQVEVYVQEHTGAVFSHGLCPSCMTELYGEFLDDSDD